MLESFYPIVLQAITAIGFAAIALGLSVLLGKKGRLTAASAAMKDLPNEEKPAYGQALNLARSAVTAGIDTKLAELQEEADQKSVEGVDLTLPPRELLEGGLHPLTLI